MSTRLAIPAAHAFTRSTGLASLAFVAGLFLTGSWPQLCVAQPAAAVPAPLPLWNQLEQTHSELSQRVTQRETSQRELKQREVAQAKLVEQIEQLKAQPAGPVRDLRLDGLLAQAKDRADELSLRSTQLQQLSTQLSIQQRKLLGLCDRMLAGEGGAVDSGKRVFVLRLRAQLSEQLYADEPERLRTLTQSSAALEKKSAPSDDPQGLRERADLLRDSADKLLREMQRLKERRETLISRQRVRQRAASVDEDLFAEQATARRGSSTSFATRAEAKAADAAVPPPLGGPGTPIGAAPATVDQPRDVGALRTSLDPAMLDPLLTRDGTVDATVQAGALLRAEGELRSLAEQLQRRATQLEQQAAQLTGKK